MGLFESMLGSVLGCLIAKFQQAGFGDVVGLWVGGGQNSPV